MIGLIYHFNLILNPAGACFHFRQAEVTKALVNLHKFIAEGICGLHVSRMILFKPRMTCCTLFIAAVSTKDAKVHTSYMRVSVVAQLVKKSTCNVGDLGSIPGLGRSPGKGKGYSLQYSGLENCMDYPWGCKESDTTIFSRLFYKV